jgi:isopenicillin-N epimerase
MTARPPPSALADRWLLDPDVVFLNHGSFGACPREVLDEQRALRERMERQPVQFFVRDLEGLVDDARAALGEFVGAPAPQLAFVPNATAAVNAVLRSFELQPGDELLTTSHAYNACRNALEFVAARADARVVVADAPFPVSSAAEVVEAVVSRATRRTRLALLDHITSPTGLVWPIAELVQALSERGVETLIDGAHAPGHVPLDLRALGATYYTGNCHKWLFAPKGAAFLFVDESRLDSVRPIAISHGANSPRADRSRFLVEFDWTGTDDPTPFLCIPAGLRFGAGLLEGGWPALMERNRALALQARDVLCEARGVSPPSPDAMIGALAAVPLPDGEGDPPASALYADPLQDALRERFSIEVPIVPFPRWPHRLVRVSAQAYNTVEQYRWLAEALDACL